MQYTYKGSTITRTTIGDKDATLVPNQSIIINDTDKNDYLTSLVEQELLVPTSELDVEDGE